MVKSVDYPIRGDVFWVNLDPTVGTEVKKTRPCVIISNNAQNKRSARVIIAPITSQLESIYPFETKVIVKGRQGKAMCDQIKSVDKKRLGKRLDTLDHNAIHELDEALKIALSLT